MQIPISGNISRFRLLKKMLDCYIKTAQGMHAQCKLSVRRILRTSRNQETRNLYKLTNNKNVKCDYMAEFTTAATKQQVKKISSRTLSKQTNRSV